MSRSLLSVWLLLAAIFAPEAAAQEGTVTVGSGGVSVTASADTRCDDPPAGDVERPFGGDTTLPYAATVTADVSVPCQHSGTADQHTARGEASANGSVTTGSNGTVINASGTVAATVFHQHSADAFAEFNQDFTVENAPVSFRLSVSGSVQLDGGLTGATSGTLQPGGHTIRGFANCSAGGGCDGFSLTLELGIPEDSDGDGLFDVWETDGMPGLDLPAMGAHPDHKDIFLEIDHMPGHALSQTAVDRVVAAFAAAPVGNPDGDDGITLHVDNGPASRMDPTTGAAWGSDSDADEVAHQTVLGAINGGNYDWTAFDAIKAANFAPARADAFHYAVSGHRMRSGARAPSGISRDFGASDLLVTLGALAEPAEASGTVTEQAGTLMHELGHNLGLHHGGDDDGNYEPNHLSIMNYAFQMTGVPRLDGTDVLDYSRLAVNLDERALDENVGFGLAAGTEPAEWLTVFRCPDDRRRWAYLQASPTDWDCDGTPRGVVARDLNGVGGRTRLVPFLEWPSLVYDGGAIGGAGAAPPDETELIEPSTAELRENAQEVRRAHVEAVAQPKPPKPGPAQPADPTPALSGLRLKPAAFKTARRGRGGATLRFRASTAGFVRFTVKRVVGRRLVRVRGSFTVAAKAGPNRTRFTGRLRGRALRPGRYRLIGTPLSARQRRPGTPRRIAFRIKRPARAG